VTLRKTITEHKVAAGAVCLIAAAALYLLGWAMQGCVLGGKPEPDYALTLEYKVWREIIPLCLSGLSLILCLCAVALWIWASWSAGRYPPRAP
jgi:hypothetical protein